MSGMTEYIIMKGSHPAHGQYHWFVPFLRTDAGKADSRYPKQRNDCTVRALALAANIPYDEAHEVLADGGRWTGHGFHFRPWATKGTANRYRFIWRPCLSVKGEMRETPVTFAMKHPRGRYIISVAKHVLAVVDGVVMDQTQNHGPMGLAYRCVYGAWELVPDALEPSACKKKPGNAPG